MLEVLFFMAYLPLFSSKMLRHGVRALVLFVVFALLISLVCGLDIYMRNVYWVQASQHAVTQPGEGLRYATPGEGRQPTVLFDADGYYYLHYARQITEGRGWRARHSDWDNAPYGRAVHWSSAVTWLTASAAWLRSVLVGGSLSTNVEWAGLMLNPFFLLFFLFGLLWLCRRGIGDWWGGVLVLSLALLPGVRKDFAYGRIDHHGLVDMAVTFSFLALIMAICGFTPSSVDKSVVRQQRIFFIAGGVCAGMGLWLQAAFYLPVLVGAWVGLAVYCVITARQGGHKGDGITSSCRQMAPELWRAWGVAGSATCVGLYMLEYFPDKMAMRLEVNNPLYGLAFLCGGELLCLLSRWANRELVMRWPVLVRCICFGAGCLLPMCAIFFGPTRWFLLRDPFLLRVHKTIGEFAPTLSAFRESGVLGISMLFAFFPVCAAGSLALVALSKVSRAHKAMLMMTAGAALPVFGLCLFCTRLVGLSLCAMFCSAVVVVAVAQEGLRLANCSRWWWRITSIGAGLCCIGWASWPCILELRNAAYWRAHYGINPALVAPIVARDAARIIGRITPISARIMAGFDETPVLQHFAQRHATGGLYWENNAGLRATVAFFAAQDMEAARAILCDRGITYVLASSAPDEAAKYVYCRHGWLDEEMVRHSLGCRLSSGTGVPEWLEEVREDTARTLPSMGYRLYKYREPQK